MNLYKKLNRKKNNVIMSLQNVKIDNSISHVIQLESIISLSLLKDKNPHNLEDISQILKCLIENEQMYEVNEY